jgi:hypothetical protein
MIYFQIAAAKGGARFETLERYGEFGGYIRLIRTIDFVVNFEND